MPASSDADAMDASDGGVLVGTALQEGAAAPESGAIVLLEAGATSCFAVDPAHDNAVLDDTIASPLKQAWTASFDGGVSYPVLAGDRVLVSANESQPNVRALDLATGAPVWGPVTFTPVTFAGAPLLAREGERIFALSGPALSAMDASSGQTLWSTMLQGQILFESPPIATGGLVYVNGLQSGGTTYAADERTGSTVWTADTFDGSFGTVAVSGGVVYEAEACDQVSAFDALSGRLNWYHSTSCTGGGGSAPAVYQGQIWVRDWALGDVILDSSGNETGKFNADFMPAFHEGTVFYTQGGTLSAVDIGSRTLKWTFAGDGNLCTSPVIAGAGGQVFVGSSLGNVYELDERTGMQRSTDHTASGVTRGSEAQAMGLGGGHLLVPTGNTLVVY
jgi:outer membrane protein assembly factor BamB